LGPGQLLLVELHDLLARVADLEEPGLTLPGDGPADAAARVPAHRADVGGSRVNRNILRVDGARQRTLGFPAGDLERHQPGQTSTRDEQDSNTRFPLHHYPPRLWIPPAAHALAPVPG